MITPISIETSKAVFLACDIIQKITSAAYNPIYKEMKNNMYTSLSVIQVDNYDAN